MPPVVLSDSSGRTVELAWIAMPDESGSGPSGSFDQLIGQQCPDGSEVQRTEPHGLGTVTYDYGRSHRSVREPRR